MRLHAKVPLLALCAFLSAALVAVSCGDDRRRGGGGDGGTTVDSGNCQGLQCYQMACTNGVQTTLTGKVFAPNGIDPVYDALVYVPTSLPDFPKKIQCEACNDPLGGTPLVTTKTAVDGSFSLSNVPATTDVPLVVQKGRFRRVVNLNVTPCTSTALPKEQTRLPKNQQEGDLPHIAVGVGNYDQIECVLRSIGIDDSEFTTPSGNGAVHLYKNYGGTGGDQLATLLTSYDQMSNYNLLFVNCTGERAEMMPSGWKDNMAKYVGAGGRLYVTDWAYDYMEQVPEFAPYFYFTGSGTETAPQPPGTAFYAWDGKDLTGKITDPTLKEWMKAAGATTDGTLNIIGSWALADHSSTNASYPSTSYVEGTADAKTRPFTATIDYNSCGKILWSSYHTQEPGGAYEAFPQYCKSTPSTMIPQEKILEYLIFQISDCVVPIS